jgi:hypothetical protein
MVVKGNLKKYIGAISSEDQAARFYDKYLIIIKGIKVRLNFNNILHSPRLISPTIETKLFLYYSKMKTSEMSILALKVGC